jgi:hypothetical protein
MDAVRIRYCGDYSYLSRIIGGAWITQVELGNFYGEAVAAATGSAGRKDSIQFTT